MLPQKIQIICTLLIGMLTGFLIDQTSPPTAIALLPPTQLASPMPFITRDSVLAVTVIVRRDITPTIKKISVLPQGRLSVTSSGDHFLVLRDEANTILYQLNFRPSYLTPNEPPELLDEITLTFIIPTYPTMKRLTLTTPVGNATEELTP